MKVIFLKPVQRVAKKYEVKDVADGYALNFLFPNQFAEMATEKSMAKLEELRKAHAAEEQVQAELLAKNLESLKEVVLTIDAKANEIGHLFASIHKEEIAERLAADAHVIVPVSAIVLAKPLKEAGEFDIEVKAGDKTGSFKVIVNAI